MQVFFVLEFDFDLILSVHAANLNLRIKRLRKVFRGTTEEARLRRLFHRIVLLLLAASNQASERFGLTNRKLFLSKLFGELCATFIGRNGQNRAGVTSRDFLLVQHLLGVFGKVKQTQSVRDGRAAFRNRTRNFRLRAVSTLHHAFVAIRLFDRVQITALEVLDKRKLEYLHIVCLFDANRNLLQASKLGGLPTTLTGNNLIALSIFANQDRLQQAIFLN